MPHSIGDNAVEGSMQAESSGKSNKPDGINKDPPVICARQRRPPSGLSLDSFKQPMRALK